jgi:hypothetical protein
LVILGFVILFNLILTLTSFFLLINPFFLIGFDIYQLLSLILFS